VSVGAARRGALVLAALALTGTACTGGDHESGPAPSPAAQLPTLSDRECPSSVDAVLLGQAECSTLTVRENRQEGTGTVQLLVATVTPPDLTHDDAIVAVGTELATRPNYAGIAPIAERTGRRVVFLEQRGTGESLPSLACPPIGDTVTWADATGSDEWRAKIANATSACHQALTDAGVDVASYDVAAMAEDLHELIGLMQLEPVDAVAYGSTSLIALELARNHPDQLRSVLLDSPDLPGVDPRASVEATTRAAFDQVLGWCDEDRKCRARNPDPTTLWRRAVAALVERPLTVPVAGDSGPVRLDAGLLARLARQSLTDGGSAGTWALPQYLPDLLSAVVGRDEDVLGTALPELLGAQGPLCAGYRPKCMPAHVVAEGVYDTVLCRNLAGDAPAPGTEPGFHEAYDQAWWWETCAHWPVPPSDSTRSPVASGVPTLVMVGGLAAPATDAEVRRQLGGFDDLTVVVVPTGSHDVMSNDCVVAFRNAWLDDPGPDHAQPDCLDQRLEW
jgi:pimeloyl-ACP methyl ester carboxylesterase